MKCEIEVSPTIFSTFCEPSLPIYGLQSDSYQYKIRNHPSDHFKDVRIFEQGLGGVRQAKVVVQHWGNTRKTPAVVQHQGDTRKTLATIMNLSL